MNSIIPSEVYPRVCEEKKLCEVQKEGEKEDLTVSKAMEKFVLDLWI